MILIIRNKCINLKIKIQRIMKKYKYTLLLIVFVFTGLSLNAQNKDKKCKVLKEGISKEYKGKCKKGLAHGYGEAKGVDTYVGQFRKGLPNGEGKYIWESGAVYEGKWKKGLRNGYGKYTFQYNGKDSIQEGIWKSDKFIGKKIKADYKITYKKGMQSVSIRRVGEGNQVEIKILRAGNRLGVSNLLLTGSSGTELITQIFIGFENIEFPFDGRLSYSAPNEFYTLNYLGSILEYTLETPGSWEIIIKN